MKTFNLAITLATAAAVAGAAGCDRPRQDAQDGWSASAPTRFCVDASNRRVPDSYCANGGYGGGYHPYFVPHGGFLPFLGGYARGGGLSGAGGVAYGRPAAFTAVSGDAMGGIARGGFGASAHGFGGAGE